jgi:hypothetical protein
MKITVLVGMWIIMDVFQVVLQVIPLFEVFGATWSRTMELAVIQLNKIINKNFWINWIENEIPFYMMA